MRRILARPPELSAYGAAPDRDTVELLRSLVLSEPLSAGGRALVEVASADGVDRGLVRLLPLVHRHPAAPDLPAAVRHRTEREHRLAGLRYVVLERTARQLTGRLRSVGIVPMFLKGFPLASQVYASPALRPMGDLDLAVRAGEFESAAAGLRELGFVETLDRPMALGPGRHAATFKHAVGAQIVDLHQYVLSFSRWPGADDGFWARSASLPIGNADALTLAPEDHLLHACLHGYAHHVLQTPFRWIVDACTLLSISGDRFRWEVLHAEAGRQRCQGVLAATLGFLARHLDAPVPPEFLADLAAVRVQASDDSYFRLHGQLEMPSLAMRLRALLASYRRHENPARLGPFALFDWIGRRWQTRSISRTVMEGLRRLPRARTDRLKQDQGADAAAQTRRLREFAAAKRRS